jgi:Undecaprenyl-phosphate glucose phosphotransferase
LLAPISVGAVVTARVMRSTHQYRFGRQEPLSLHVARVAAAAAVGGGLALIVGALLDNSDDPARVPMEWVVAMGITLAALHAAWWTLVRRWRTAGRLTPNVVIVGATSHAQRLIDEAMQRRGVNVLGVFDDRMARVPQQIFGVPVLGDTDALLTHRITPFVDRIVVAVDPSARSRVREITDRLAALPNEVVLMVDDEQGGRSDALDRLADAPLAPLDVESDPDRRAFAKRLQDIVLGGLTIVVLAPVLAVIALIVRVDSPGPVFFRQRRHGFNNEEIVVWKFRSMRDDARDERAERQVTADDDRVTKVGRILRKTSLDELPQLLNVLRGEMSLVGPRPHAIGMKTGDTEAAQLVSDYAKRHRMKPGMTGLAAVRGSRGPLHTAAEVRHRVALDIEYIERQTFWLDVVILARTIPSVFGDQSAIR